VRSCARCGKRSIKRRTEVSRPFHADYKGARAGRPHVATWAEAGLAIAADLLAGDEDPRPGAADLIAAAAGTLHAVGVRARPRVRGDVGYFAGEIAWAALDNGCDFSLGVVRNKAVWGAAAAIGESVWRAAKRMRGAPGRRDGLLSGRVAAGHQVRGAPGQGPRRGPLC